MESSITLKAKHIHTIFNNPSNGYTVAKFVSYDSCEEAFIGVGFFHKLETDIIYELHGNYVEHVRYGMQFQIQSYSIVQPNDYSNLVRYFSSSLFPGIGKKLASDIVDCLGEEAIARIREDEHVLDQITSLNDVKKQSIIQGIQSHDESSDSVLFLMQHGLSLRLISKIESTYGSDSISVVKENPYKLIEDIDGIGFKTADKLAMELSFSKDHPYRIKALILSVILEACITSGDSYTNVTSIHRYMHRYDVDSIDLDSYLEQLRQERLVIMEEDRIYHHTQYDAECGIATFLHGFCNSKNRIRLSDFEEALSHVEEELSIQYDQTQKEAMLGFFQHSLSLISGGPGTGKSTIVQGILKLCDIFCSNLRIALCAPTGRAAKRLYEIGGYPATTLHSLLKWDLDSNSFQADEQNPIPYDIVIIDEFSMVDAWLFYHFAQASRGICKLLILGDEDQLPSVGCGSVLRDILQSEMFHCTRLHKIFRQKEGSGVVELARQIREEQPLVWPTSNDVSFVHAKAHTVKDEIQRVVAHLLSSGYTSSMIQVLAPMYSGIAGIDSINYALQAMLNPVDVRKQELKIGYRIYREHDKVLQLKNQPDDDVYNGDIGEIIEIIPAVNDREKKDCIVCDFDGIIVEYRGEDIYNLTHAYCISVHKAQGSEYPVVILSVVSDYRNMLQKRLLYTALTRAKTKLIVIGELDVFERSIHRKDIYDRKTTLTNRLLNMYNS